eukprot:1740350-Pyramimonas_sp.AAC.1
MSSGNSFFSLLASISLFDRGAARILDCSSSHLVVADHARVCEVVHPGESPPRHLDGHGQHLVQDGHGVGDVHHLLVVGDLVHEVARVGQVGGDGHAHAQREHMLVVVHEALHQCLGEGVEGAHEVGFVILLEADTAAHGVGGVVLEDAAGGEVGHVDAA